MTKNVICIIIFSLLLFSCSKNESYNNRKFRYKVNYPVGWIGLTSDSTNEEQKTFINRLEIENALILHENVDVAIYNKESFSPVYDVVTVSTIQKYININNIPKSRTELEALFSYQLETSYSDVRLLRSEYADYSIGKTYRIDYKFYYGEVECFASIIILTSNLFYSNLITLICRYDRERQSLEARDFVVNSFKKY